MDELFGPGTDIAGLTCPCCGSQVAADLRTWRAAPYVTCRDCGLTLDVETSAITQESLVRADLAA
jgi:transcription elongation factor Elf1